MSQFRASSVAIVIALATFAILLFVAKDVEAGVIENLDEEMSYNPDEVQSYLNALESYYQGRNEKSKRWVYSNSKRVASGKPQPARRRRRTLVDQPHYNRRGVFCLRRDTSCPYLENGRDICCKGSQCSCNIFGQNCKCSTIGLFQRLG